MGSRTGGNGGCLSLLMSPPHYFGVTYEINPWMDPRRGVDGPLARRQWDALYRVLTEEVGANVHLVAPVPGLSDFVFTANAGLVAGSTFIPSNFRHPERAREEPHWRAWFDARGYRIVSLPPRLRFEGQGDVLPCGELLVAGHRFRSEYEAVRQVGRLLDRELLPLELADPWFYHLDTCFCPVSQGTVLYYPQAFTAEGRAAIQARFPDAIPVEADEARRFACNSIVVGEHVVMSRDCPRAKGELLDRGYEVHEVDVGEFLKAGGGARCLALSLAPVAEPSAADAGVRVRMDAYRLAMQRTADRVP